MRIPRRYWIADIDQPYPHGKIYRLGKVVVFDWGPREGIPNGASGNREAYVETWMEKDDLGYEKFGEGYYYWEWGEAIGRHYGDFSDEEEFKSAVKKALFWERARGN